MSILFSFIDCLLSQIFIGGQQHTLNKYHMKLTRRVLYLPAKQCDFKWPMSNNMLAQQMTTFMKQQQGIGLAAPQIGIRKRLFVMAVADQKERHCFNPEITSVDSELIEMDEGCLSFIDESYIILRPGNIKVRYQTSSGTFVSEELSGLLSRCFQHELDHLNGIVMQQRYKEQHANQSRN